MDRPRHYRSTNEQPQQPPQRPTPPPNKRIIVVNNPKQADIARRKFPDADVQIKDRR